MVGTSQSLCRPGGVKAGPGWASLRQSRQFTARHVAIAWTTPQGRTTHPPRDQGRCPLTCRTCQRHAAGEPDRDERALRIATAVKFECLRAAVESYDDARIRGLCQEGAWDLAMDALKSIDIEAVLKRLPD